jgi:2,3-bisphosphoglycerate-dependent phosphoglycerate mutase
MATLLLARHGETDWNAEHRWQGHSDVPLNDRGRAQARALADDLEPETLAAIYSSDLLRAYETARTVAERKGMDVIVDRALRETNLGVWEGLTSTEIERRFPDDWRVWRDGGVPAGRGGETPQEARERVVEVANRIAAAHEGEQVLVVAHGGVLRHLALHADLVLPETGFPNCHVLRVEYRDGAFRAVH